MVAGGVASPAVAQVFPAKPIRLIVPYPVGGPTDIVARLVADRLRAFLGQAVVVDNRPGAGTNIGTEAVVRSTPDGHTILMASFANALNKALFPAITWDPVGDLAGVTQISTAPIVMTVPAASAVDSLAAFIALAKKDPGKLNYGVGGAGSSSHLAVELLKSMAGIDVVPIIYKGGGPAMQGLLQGDVQLMFDNVQTLMPMVNSGKIRALAVTSKTRTPTLPQLPALHEALPGYELYSWYGLLAPARTPPEALRILQQAVGKVLASHDAYIEQALAMKAKGLRAYKVHPPSDFDATVRLCRALRDTLGADYRLMIDPCGALDYPQALRLGRILEELDFYWYEDPLAEDDLYNYVKLRQKLDIPLMATEYSPGGFHSYAPWVTQQATDYLRGDVAIKGGLTAILKAAHLAEAFQMNYEIHHGGNSLNNFANLHVMMAIRNCEYFEVLLPDRAQKYGLVRDIEVDAEGYVHAVDGPGLGADIDFDLIKHCTTDVLR